MGSQPEKRQRRIQRLAALLSRRGSPRFQMLLILAATGLAGFLSSKLLHVLGLTSMRVRYPLAVGFAYLVFLLLLAVYLWFFRSHRHLDAGDAIDVVDQGLSNFEYDPEPARSSMLASSGNGSSGKSSGVDKLDLGDGDGAAILVVILIVIAIVSALVASMFIIIEAPILLAEVLVDGLLVIGLARKIRWPGPHWTVGVVRRTYLPLIAVAVCFGLVGYGLESLVPSATTMGEALQGAGKR